MIGLLRVSLLAGLGSNHRVERSVSVCVVIVCMLPSPLRPFYNIQFLDFRMLDRSINQDDDDRRRVSFSSLGGSRRDEVGPGDDV